MSFSNRVQVITNATSICALSRTPRPRRESPVASPFTNITFDVACIGLALLLIPLRLEPRLKMRVGLWI
ncbi:hypothetical protein C8R46DRAFT_1359891 [Mycena filopes]|nr:hypothetical protein C8R46DRAFT_1359891 [Mycena filopes]